MPNIDNLSIEFTAKGTETAVKNIKAMGYAIRNLSQTLKTIDGNKVKVFADSMETLKKSVPTKNQADRMVNFGNAVKDLSSTIGTANIGSFSKDMSTLGSAVEAFKKSSVNSITNAVSAMQNLQTQTRETANTINSVKPKSQKVNLNNNKPVDMASSVKTVIPLLDKVESKSESIKSKFKGIFVPTKPFKTLEEQASKVAQKYDDLRKKMQEALKSGSMEVGDDKFKKQSAELDALRNKYNDLILKQKELALSGGAVQLNPTLKTSLEAFSSGFSKVTHLIRNGFVAGIKSANSHLKSFATRIRQTVSAAKNAITSGHKATDMAKKFANELTRMSKMLKLMIVRKALRAVIAEVGNGFQSLAIHSDEFNNAMSNLINGSKKLGYSFAAMVSPLINALAPAIVYVIELLTKLANIINQVFSALTGATVWNKAKNFTDSWRDSIEGAGSAAKKTAKELKKTVLGFDELNQLQENKDSSSGSGSGITDMFETLPIDQKWKDIADWLKKMWEIGDFYELGKKLGEKLRDWLESIPWEKIRKTANKLGGALASLINGFVEVERLGYDIGKTIAQSVNTVFEFLNGFVRNLHWASIGKFIADTFNGFFENIDWDLIKDTVITGMRGIAQAIWQFIQEFHWDNISDFIKNGLDTIAKGIRAFFETPGYDDRGFKLNDSWAKRLGKEIGHQLSKVFEDKELWHEVGQALGDLVQGAIDFLSGYVSELDVKDVVDSLTEMVNGFFEQVNSEQAGKTLGELLQKLYDIIKGFWKTNGEDIKNEVKDFFKGIWDNIDKEELGKILGGILGIAVGFGIGKAGWEVLKIALTAKIKAMVTGAAGAEAVTTAATGAGSAIAGFIVGGISAGLGALLGSVIAEPIKRVAFDIGESIAKATGNDQAAEKIRNMHEAYNGLDGSLKLVRDGFKEFYELLGGEVDRSIYQLTDDAGNTTKVVDDLGNTIIEFTNSADDASKSVGDLAITIEKDTSNAASSATKSFDDLTKSVSSIKFDPLIEGTKRLDGDTTRAFSNMKEQVSVASRTIDRDTQFAWANVKKNTEDAKIVVEDYTLGWAGAQQEISGVVKELTLNTDSGMKDVQKSVSDSMNEVNKSFDTVKDAMDEKQWTFDGVGEGLKSTFEKAKNGIKGVWNSIADTLNGEHQIGGSNLKIRLPKFYATGGFPEDGLFFANHSELVGTFSNGKTAVANNAQIVEGIQKGVYSAVSSAMAQNNSGSRYIANEIVVDGEVIARTVSVAQDRQDRRYSPSMG